MRVGKHMTTLINSLDTKWKARQEDGGYKQLKHLKVKTGGPTFM
jgi:hypothetical protein